MSKIAKVQTEVYISGYKKEILPWNILGDKKETLSWNISVNQSKTLNQHT